jgi:hypothetical protein
MLEQFDFVLYCLHACNASLLWKTNMETARTHSMIIASYITDLSISFMVHQRQCVVEHHSTFSRVFLVVVTCMDEASTQASPSLLDSVGTRDRAFPIVTHAEPHDSRFACVAQSWLCLAKTLHHSMRRAKAKAKSLLYIRMQCGPKTSTVPVHQMSTIAS